jgi:hypothetical protein
MLHLAFMVSRNPSADQPVTAALRIWSTDLTDDGMAVVKTGFDKWLRSLDKGTDVKNISILNSALKKFSRSKWQRAIRAGVYRLVHLYDLIFE